LRLALCDEFRFHREMLARSTIAALCLLLCTSARGENASATLPSVAVLEFAVENDEARANALTGLVEAELDERGFKVVDRRTLEKTLEEQAMSVAGLTDPAAAANIGRLAGAKLLVSGRLLETKQEIVFALRLTNTDTATIKPAKVVFQPRTAPSKIAAAIAEKVQELSAAATPALSPKPDNSDKVAALTAAAAGRELPALAVSIPEHHIGRRVPDPAAETEIVRLLHKLGFTVIKTTAAKEEQPPVRVEGEAFSEFGMQAGRMISCRARVEVKVVDTASNKVLFADSEHASGVDVAENIAGKVALRTAGEQLAPRIAEFLLKRTQ
jgi:TolB-like protein